MPVAHCHICLSHLTIDKFVVFPCGHGFCIDCKQRIFQDSARSKCPNCRITIRNRDAHPVFLELVDSKVSFASTLVDGLDKMNHETPLLSVKKAGQKLGKVLQGSQPEANAMTALIKAAEDFNERIIPLFTKVEAQSHQIMALREGCLESRQKIENLQALLRKAEHFQKKCTQLELQLKDTERNENEAIRLAEIAKNDLGEVHESLVQWKKQASELTAENKRYKHLLEKQVESARLRGEKQKKLQKRVVELTQKLAAKERETMSDATQDYDGDFSAHEHSMMRSSLMSMSSRTTHHIQDENHIDLDMEGMPPPKFPSDWQLNKPTHGALKRRNLNDAFTSERGPNTFPIDLDGKGRPTKAVQLGPRSLIHIAHQGYYPS